MRGILADINAEGILTNLRFIWLSAAWREFWFSQSPLGGKGDPQTLLSIDHLDLE